MLNAADPEQPSELRKVARSNTLEGSNPAWPAVVVGISKLRSGGRMRLEAYDSDLGSMQDGLIGQVNFLLPDLDELLSGSTRTIPLEPLAPPAHRPGEARGRPPRHHRRPP